MFRCHSSRAASIARASRCAVVTEIELGNDTATERESTVLRELGRRCCGIPTARGGWLCMPFTATTLVPSMWMRALQFVFLEVQRQITLSRNLDSSQKGKVFTIIITFPRRDFRNLMPAGKTIVNQLSQ